MVALVFLLTIMSSALLGAYMPNIPSRYTVYQEFLQGNQSNLITAAGLTGVPNIANIACRPQIDMSRTIQVDVNDQLGPWYINNPAHPEFNKEGKTYILVKQNAPIPAWKVLTEHAVRGTHAGIEYAEMEKIGIGLPAGTANPDVQKDVYIGIGWCNPDDGVARTGSRPGCLDPLVQDVLFVVSRKGAEQIGSDQWIASHRWGRDDSITNPPKTQENLEKYYWEFNVYIDASKLPPNPTYADLPEWMKLQCPQGSDVNGIPRCEADPECLCAIRPSDPRCTVLGFTTATDNPRLVIKFSELDNINASLIPAAITPVVTYISLGQIPAIDPATDIYLGRAYLDHFDVYLRVGEPIPGNTSDHAIILSPAPTGRTEPLFIFGPIQSVSAGEDPTLQLGTFKPGLPLAIPELPTSLYYEWWTPSCKPALYLYPENTTAVSVTVDPQGTITQSIPPYNNGWNVIAHPDGRIEDTANSTAIQIYPYLYYEAAVRGVVVPKSTGWIKKDTDLSLFFTTILPELGLTTTEIHDFLDYWIPQLTSEGTTWYITLIPEEEVDRVEKLTISPQPDTTIRVRFYFEKLDEKAKNNSTIQQFITPPRISKKPRTGFTLVDWGGIMGNGSCGESETIR